MTIFPGDPLAVHHVRKNWVPDIARGIAGMVDEWGPKCEDFDAECACCVAWQLFEAHPARPHIEAIPSVATVSKAIRG